MLIEPPEVVTPLEDNAVLGQVPRTVIALGLAASAITAAILQHRADRDNVGAQALLATGVSSTFLSVLSLTVVFRNDVGGPLVPAAPGVESVAESVLAWRSRCWPS